MGAVQDLPAKKHSQSSQFSPKLGSQDIFLFNILIFIYFFKYETIETHARAFLSLIILAVDTVQPKEGLKNSPNWQSKKKSQTHDSYMASFSGSIFVTSVLSKNCKSKIFSERMYIHSSKIVICISKVDLFPGSLASYHGNY